MAAQGALAAARLLGFLLGLLGIGIFGIEINLVEVVVINLALMDYLVSRSWSRSWSQSEMGAAWKKNQ